MGIVTNNGIHSKAYFYALHLILIVTVAVTGHCRREDGYGMRTFSWKYFTLTGDVDAYLLYKDIHQFPDDIDMEDEMMDEEDVLDIDQ